MKKIIFLLLFLIEAQLSFAQSNPVNASVLDTVSKSDFRIPFWHPHFRGLHEYKIALERNNLFVIRTDNVKDLEDWNKVENSLNLFIKDFPQVIDSTRSPLESRSLLYLVSGNDRTLEIKYHTPQKESFRLSMTDGINQLKTQQDSVIIRVGQNEINKNYCILLLFNQIGDLASLMDELKTKFLKLNNNPTLILKPDNRNRLSILNVLNEDSNLRFEKTVKRADYLNIGMGFGMHSSRHFCGNMTLDYNFSPKPNKNSGFNSLLIGGDIRSIGRLETNLLFNVGFSTFSKKIDIRQPLGFYLRKKFILKFNMGIGTSDIINTLDNSIKTYIYPVSGVSVLINLHKNMYLQISESIKINYTSNTTQPNNWIRSAYSTGGLGFVWYPTFNFSKKTN